MTFDIVYFGFEPFAGRTNRCHHFARLLAERHRVFYVDPPLSLLRTRNGTTRCEPGGPNIEVVTLPAGLPGRNLLPLHELNQFRWLRCLKRLLARRDFGQKEPRVCIHTVPNWDRAAAALAPDLTVYDAQDAWGLIPPNSPRLVERLERRHAASAALVLAASEYLHRLFERYGARPVAMPNACEGELFSSAAAAAPPADIAAIAPPRILFTGGIDECFDAEAVRAAASDLKDASFVLVGPETVLHRPLHGLPNVYFLPPRPYAQMPGCLAAAAACIVPYRLGERTLARDPVKLYEYLATGLPIVATPLPRAKEFAPFVTVSDGSPQSFAAACRQALSPRPPSATQAQKELARRHTWRIRVGQLERLLEQCLAGQASGSSGPVAPG